MYLTIFKPHSQGGRRLYFTKSSQVFCVIDNLLLGANNIIKYLRIKSIKFILKKIDCKGTKNIPNLLSYISYILFILHLLSKNNKLNIKYSKKNKIIIAKNRILKPKNLKKLYYLRTLNSKKNCNG